MLGAVMDQEQQKPVTSKFRTIVAVLGMVLIIVLIYTINLKTTATRQQHRIDTLLQNIDSLKRIVNPVEEQKDSIARLLDIERVKADTIN